MSFSVTLVIKFITYAFAEEIVERHIIIGNWQIQFWSNLTHLSFKKILASYIQDIFLFLERTGDSGKYSTSSAVFTPIARRASSLIGSPMFS